MIIQALQKQRFRLLLRRCSVRGVPANTEVCPCEYVRTLAVKDRFGCTKHGYRCRKAAVCSRSDSESIPNEIHVVVV